MSGINGESKTKFRDFYGNPLVTGIYLHAGPSENVFFIKLAKDGEDFTVEGYNVEVYDSNHPEKDIFARQFVRLSKPAKTLEFALSKLTPAERQSLLEKLALIEKS